MTATITRINRPESWRRSFIARHGARCHYCNRAGSLDEGPGQRPWHVDHMNPLARGGADSEENLTLACKRCNIAKNATPYEDFKAFAGAAWWQDRDGIDNGELDSLMSQWHATQRWGHGHWWFDRDEDGHILIVDGSDDGPRTDDASPIFRSYFRGMRSRVNRDGAEVAAEFILAAHKMIPDLIAEIRQLRAELEEKEVAA